MTENKTAENLAGICLVVLAMAGFAIEDSIIKFLAQRLSPGQILVMIGLGGTSVFYILLRANGIFIKRENSPTLGLLEEHCQNSLEQHFLFYHSHWFQSQLCQQLSK